MPGESKLKVENAELDEFFEIQESSSVIFLKELRPDYGSEIRVTAG